MLTKTIKTTKQVPVNIIKFKWFGPVSEKLHNLRCTACRSPIGDKDWGQAWAEDEKGKYPMRLCNKCGKKAEQALKDNQKT